LVLVTTRLVIGTTGPTPPAAATRHARLAATGLAGPGSQANPASCAAGTPAPPSAAQLGQAAAGMWPNQTFLQLDARDEAVPSARLHARHVLREWGLARLTDGVELLVSELATNGVQASRAVAHDAVRLWLVSDREQVVIMVWDASPLRPARADPGGDAEYGRGLLLVEAISQQWGWYVAGQHGSTSPGDRAGKVVWAVVRLRPAGAAAPEAAHGILLQPLPHNLTASPGKVSDIARAALVLSDFGRGFIV